MLDIEIPEVVLSSASASRSRDGGVDGTVVGDLCNVGCVTTKR